MSQGYPTIPTNQIRKSYILACKYSQTLNVDIMLKNTGKMPVFFGIAFLISITTHFGCLWSIGRWRDTAGTASAATAAATTSTLTRLHGIVRDFGRSGVSLVRVVVIVPNVPAIQLVETLVLEMRRRIGHRSNRILYRVGRNGSGPALALAGVALALGGRKSEESVGWVVEERAEVCVARTAVVQAVENSGYVDVEKLNELCMVEQEMWKQAL
ncbi:hypothetical protein HYALB_00010756 [Hymenoscyphus albidus]|uniref:Uncharacterized protein n=1 Tax=Hymenoscyphus albidus TaxID=595503 RepID=A0A9N9LFW9_9HELO|nr:hypothetical protein HYALB_00010756 [Hymenoscyphus albidus]